MNNVNMQSVVIVDGYTTGKYLQEEIVKRGLNCIHVKSQKTLPKYVNWKNSKDDFIKEIDYTGNLDAIKQDLGGFTIAAVMAGTETGVELSEQLAQALHLAGNPTCTSHLRVNKFDAIEAICQSGLLTAKQYLANTTEELIAWYQENFNHGDTIVLKPLNNDGINGARFCSSVSDIFTATQNILQKIGKHDGDKCVLAQSFLDGMEYIVNTVSVNGQHHLCDIWESNKEQLLGTGYVSSCEILYPYYGFIQESLRKYTFKALEALGFLQGPATFKIMLTNRGPAIIGVDAKIQEGISPNVLVDCLGSCQLTKSVDSYLAPNIFMHYCAAPYQLKKFSRWVYLIAPRSGKLSSFKLMDEVQKLASFHSSAVNLQKGDYIEKTIDRSTSPGSVFLVNEDPIKLESDYLAFRKLEKMGYEFCN